jgi:hypothetical protein
MQSDQHLARAHLDADPGRLARIGMPAGCNDVGRADGPSFVSWCPRSFPTRATAHPDTGSASTWTSVRCCMTYPQ